MDCRQESMTRSVVPKNKLLSPAVYTLVTQSVPIVCVDLVIFRRRGRLLETLLIKRKISPEIGKWCIIGGRILKNESIEESIVPQAKRELGLTVKILKPWNARKPAGVFNAPWADAKKHYVSLTYPVIIVRGAPRAFGPEFSEAKWFAVNRIPARMGFSHREQVLFAAIQVKS